MGLERTARTVGARNPDDVRKVEGLPDLQRAQPVGQGFGDEAAPGLAAIGSPAAMGPGERPARDVADAVLRRMQRNQAQPPVPPQPPMQPVLSGPSRAAIARSIDPHAVQVRRFTLPWRKTPAQQAGAALGDAASAVKAGQEKEAQAAHKARIEATQQARKSRRDGGATLGGVAAAGLKERADGVAAIEQSRRDGGATLGDIVTSGRERLATQKAFDGYAGGVAGARSDVGFEIAKPTLAVSAAGAAGLGTQFGQSVSGLSGPAGNMALGPLLMGDAALGLNNARKMDADAREHGDIAMGNMAGRKAKDQSQALLGATVATTKAGVGIAAKVGASAGSAALGVAGGALGVAGGSAMVLQGAWRGGKAVMKLCRLAWGRASTMLSERGAQWKKAIVSAERYKAAIAAMKVTLGVLGIAAGALLIVSNPVGWGIGIAAAIAGGVYAGTKIAAKIKNASDRQDAAAQIAAGKRAEAAFADIVEPRGADEPIAEAPAKLGAAPKKGFTQPKKVQGAATKRDVSRQKAIEQANEVARMASSNARLAAELRGALSVGHAIKVTATLEQAEKDPIFDKNLFLRDPLDRELHDAYLLLSSINVDPDEALADSGQDLIEKKLSKAEAM